MKYIRIYFHLRVKNLLERRWQRMQIERVDFLEDYIIKLELSGNQEAYFDLKPLLKTARFKHIVTEEFFKRGKLLDHCCIYWDDVTEIQDYELLGEDFIRRNL